MIDLHKIVRPNILSLKPYSSARDEFMGKEGIFLDANENPFGTLNRYPDPYQKELKVKLANLKKVDTKQIFIGNGSDEVIDLALRIFCEPGQNKALTFSPTYGMYDVSTGINNVDLIKLPLSSTFDIERSTLLPYLGDKDLKLIFICSPNNPTGNSIKREDIEFILSAFSGVIIVDEAYIDFSEKASLIDLLNEYDNLIISQTFSKAWGLAAARVGVAYSNPAIINFFNKVKPPYNISHLNQEAAISAIENYSLYEERLSKILSEKERMRSELKHLDLVKEVYPSDANFLLVKVDDATATYEQLILKKVVTRNRHKLIENCLRITIGKVEENNQLLSELRKIK